MLNRRNCVAALRRWRFTSNLSPSWVNSSLRRGDADANTIRLSASLGKCSSSMARVFKYRMFAAARVA
jgi:hypothetical protein